MISPLVTLNRRSCVIIHRVRKHASGPGGSAPGPQLMAGLMLGGPLNGATGFADGGRRLVTGNDFIDAVEILGVVLALRLRLADEGRRHQLMVALAVVDLV